MSWNKMCYPKEMGGMGCRRVREFNLAMLGKQAWHVMMKSQSFISKLLKARYFPKCSFIYSELGRNPSYVWHSIITAKNLVIEGNLLKVGEGASIKVWSDPWIPDAEKKELLLPWFLVLKL